MPKIEKLKNGYRARVSTGERMPNGNYRYISISAPTKAEVRRKIAEFDENRDRALDAHTAGRITLADAMDKFLDTCRAAGRSPSTIRGYVAMRRNSYDEQLLRKPISAITRADLQSLVNQWVSAGDSAKSVKNRLAFLSAAMNHCDTPAPATKLVLPEIEEKDLVLPQDEDVQRALFYLNGHNTQLYLAVVLAATIGMRRGEIAALTMDDFDFDARTVSINKAVSMDENGNYIVKQTKTKKSKRVIGGLDTLILSAVKKYGNPSPGPLISMSPNAITTAYDTLRKKLNLPGRFHDLRHYAVAVMAAINVPMLYARDITGHSSMNMINRVYYYPLKKKTDAVSESIAEHSAALLSGEIYDYTSKASS